MIIAKRLKGKAIAAWLGPTGDAARRAARNVRDQLKKEPRRLDLYFDIADPWSYLLAQAATRLVEAYAVDIAVHVVTPPASDVDPQPTLRAKHAVRDAQLLAEFWDLDFPGKKEADPGALREVGSALIRERPGKDQLRAAVELSQAMWAGDRKQLAQLLGTWGTESTNAIAPALNATYAELRKAGHYQGAMIRYAGEWYWGIDRLPYLEAQLAQETGRAIAGVVSPRPESERGALALSQKPLTCEMWFSFRSPYSYLALEQIESVLGDVPLQLRPVLPMVMRGLEVPTVKQLYIVRDAKREADRLGIEFGVLCDPVGPGTENCIALAYWAEQRGKQLAFAKSAMRGIWAEARDMTEYVDLRYVVERAELPWEEAKAALDDAKARKWAQANAADLAVIGLWGVPSLRCGDFVAWGQDRLPLLADRLRRHRLANGS
ncbi:MAG TPA: DsbA family protein [Kofleriaceae bacterium]|nr:DsbA family protein [Kofleriaceae bacterium]